MIADVYVFESITDYMKRYKQFIELEDFHTPVVHFLASKKSLLVLVDYEKINFRPDYNRSLIILNEKKINSVPSDLTTIDLSEIIYNHKKQSIDFKPHKYLKFLKPIHSKHINRIIGKPTSSTVISNCLFDFKNNRLNFILLE